MLLLELGGLGQVLLQLFDEAQGFANLHGRRFRVAGRLARAHPRFEVHCPVELQVKRQRMPRQAFS